MAMTAKQAIDQYTEMFGGFPAFLLMGATDEEIVKVLTECIETGKELQATDPDADY